MGWEYWYHFFDKKDLESIEGTFEWNPTFLDEIQYRVMNVLCLDGELDFDEVPSIEKDAREYGYLTVDDLIKSLCDTGMVARIDTKKIRLLTRDCQVMMLGDKFIMGESSDRLNNWLIRHSDEMLPWK
jgi:predicted transcriptional regulator